MTTFSLGHAAPSRAPREVVAGGRAAAALPASGLAVYLAASLVHGGERPDDLPAVLPQYASNDLWLLSHAGQLLGVLLLLAGLAVHLLREPSRPRLPATAARTTTGLAAGVFAVNQAVDAVAVRHVAQAYVDSPPALRPTALHVADAVRHVEIGLTSCFQALLGAALLLTAVAVRSSTRWFAALSAVVGAGWLALAADVAANGFANPAPVSAAALGLVVWAVGLTVLAARPAARAGRAT